MNTLKRNKTKLKALGANQVFGGIFGIVLIISFLPAESRSNFLTALLLLFIAAFYVFSFISGVLLFTNIQKGIRLSFVNQLLQVFSVGIGGGAYKYCAGSYFIVVIDLTESFSFNFDLGLSTFLININSDTKIFLAGFNVIAFVLVIYLSAPMKKNKNRKKRIAYFSNWLF